jgi:hypothetical protein
MFYSDRERMYLALFTTSVSMTHTSLEKLFPTGTRAVAFPIVASVANRSTFKSRFANNVKILTSVT